MMVSLSIRRALEGMDGPVGVIDRDALDVNVAALKERSHGVRIRVATKSVRVPEALRHVLSHDSIHGIMAYSLQEALALSEEGFHDILVGYPTTNRPGLRRLARSAKHRENITVMVDSPDHLDYVEKYLHEGTVDHSASDVPRPPVRLCLDVDASLRVLEKVFSDTIHVGARRSPIRTPEQAVDVAHQIAQRPHFKLVGIMSYEGQIAGQADAGYSPKAWATRVMQRISRAELKQRRTKVIDAIRQDHELEFVNGGGTGSLESSAAEGTLTEVAVGSGFLSPGLFDGYTSFRHRPAAFIATPVVRRPAPGWVTLFQGGWVASGPAGRDRLPTVDWPEGLSYSPTEGPGEVQTPLHGPGADLLSLGDLVYLRDAKAGEPAEHLNEYLVVSNGQVVDTWSTYRGRGWAF
ncbi:alanine racemase [Kocuria sp. HSID16901]|uniref:alanine racemase n=1 Tax=Kocuria sp. HSID16901 TaxID=2419505 RepID=UPI001EE99ADF|nr:alanine racemase [Kocuria sp. HSID16901]